MNDPVSTDDLDALETGRDVVKAGKAKHQNIGAKQPLQTRRLFLLKTALAPTTLTAVAIIIKVIMNTLHYDPSVLLLNAALVLSHLLWKRR